MTYAEIADLIADAIGAAGGMKPASAAAKVALADAVHHMWIAEEAVAKACAADTRGDK